MHASLHVVVGPSHVLQLRFPAPRSFVCFPPPSFDAFPSTFPPSSSPSLLRLVSCVSLSRTFARSCVALVWVWPPPLRGFHSIGGGLGWGVEFLTPKGWIGTHPPFHRGGEKRSGPSLEKKKGNEGRWRWDQSVLSQSPHLWTFVGVPHSNGEVRPEEEKKKHRIEGSISKPRENPLFMKLSNAIPDNFNRGQALGSMAQWIRRRSTEPKIRGSIPRGVKVSTAAHHRNDVHNAMQGIHALRATAKFRFLDSVDTEAGRRHRPSTCDLRRDAR